uniref:Uncharacterized protein n=1 Tax=Anguilla anguilla TaxID=7936 RepID=A0A0E9UGY9_ANGAN
MLKEVIDSSGTCVLQTQRRLKATCKIGSFRVLLQHF